MLATCVVLILTGQTDLPYHHWQETTPQIERALARHTGCSTRRIEVPQAITSEALAGAQVLAINYNGPRLGRAQESAIEKFVEKGGGLFAFHHALYGEWFGHQWTSANRWAETSDRGWSAWEKMIGARWDSKVLGHTRRGPFTVLCPNHAACPAPAFEANDELYHRFTLAPTVEIIASAFSDAKQGGTGQNQPLAWTHRFGQGRVFFTTLGHDATALFPDSVQQFFARSIAWTAATSIPPPPAPAAPLRVLAVTGGHGYPTAFYSALDQIPGLRWQHVHTHAEMIRVRRESFDVLLLHDMYDQTAPEARKWLEEWVRSGKGIVSLHHAIVDYSDWPWWWREVTGGKYFVEPLGEHKKSSYKEDVPFTVTPAPGKERHPVLEGVPPLLVDDEMYKDMWHAPGIEVLMETAHPLNDRPVVYIGPAREARVLYIQLGHSASTFQNPGFRRLLANALAWTARRK